MSANTRVLINENKVEMKRPPLVIGRGAMGEVLLARYQNKAVVIKKSQRDIIDNTLLKEYSNYFKLQDHNNILKFFGVIRNDRYSFSLVLEYAPNGNLSSYLRTNTVGWDFKARICRDVALGLMHCHDNNVLHFDLKPENILLDKNLTPKLADFGISKSKSQMVLDNGKAGGTLNYVAPERISLEPKMREFFYNHPKLSDIYSYGLILWSVSKSGEHPYEGMEDEYIKEQKKSAHSIYRLLNQLPENTPPNFHQLIYDLTKYNPSERIDLAIARIELEFLFDDGEEDHHETVNQPHQSENSLVIDSSDEENDVNDDDGDDENFIAGSEPVSTTTTIESDKYTLGSDKEITTYTEEPSSREVNYEETKSPDIVYRALVLPRKQSSYSECSKSKKEHLVRKRSSYSGSTSKINNILGETLVDSPMAVDKNPIGIEIPTTNSLGCTTLFTQIINSNGSNSSSSSNGNNKNNGNNGSIKNNGNNGNNIKHNKHDSGVSGMARSQTTLVGSPKIEETPYKSKMSDVDISLLKSRMSNPDILIIDDVIALCDNWEKHNDDVIRRKLEILCHEKGIKPKDLLEIFEKSQLRSVDYYFIIGFMNEHAFGKPKDPRMAFECYYKAADEGDLRGLVFTGWCYYKGMGTKKDPQKAFNCFQRAANNGCVSAYNNVGWCYDIGFGTSTDPYKAFECFKISAEKGYATAQCRVGVCYEYGRGTPKDLEKALEWYTKAAENGHETAKRRVSELSKLIRRGKRRSFLSSFSFSNFFH